MKANKFRRGENRENIHVPSLSIFEETFIEPSIIWSNEVERWNI